MQVVTLRIDQRIVFFPGIVSFFQGPHWQLNAGTSFRFNMSKSKYDEQAFPAWTLGTIS